MFTMVKFTMEDLPDEILEYIISLTSSYKDLEDCKLVCKRWHRSVLNVIRFKKNNLLRAIAENKVRWQHMRPSDMAPTITKRYSHSACCYGNSMYVFGGCTSTSTTFNDLWRLDLTRRQWVRPLAMGSYPSPKACASLVIHRDNLVLFGGWTHPSPYPLHQAWRLFNELHLYSMESNRWILSCTPSTPPPPTAGHSASVHRDNMVVFGGLQMQGGLGHYANSNDVWVFDLENPSWHKQAIAPGPKPHARYGQSQIPLDEDHLLIIGGCGGPNMVFSDVWLLKMKDAMWSWKELPVQHQQWAAAHMWCHPACKVGQNVVVLSRSQGINSIGPSAPSIRLPADVRLGAGASQMLRPHTSNIWVPPRAEVAMEEEASHSSHLRNGKTKERDRNPKKPSSLGRESNHSKGESSSSNASSSSVKAQSTSSSNASPPVLGRSKLSGIQKPFAESSHSSPLIPPHRLPLERLPYGSSLCISPEERSSLPHQMAAFRTTPALQGRYRQMQLESLRRMEEELCGRRGVESGVPPERLPQPHAPPPPPSPPPPLPRRRPQRTMSLHVLDTSKALAEEDPFVSWLPVQPISETFDSNIGPEETILYTLVPGKGELIMFGGIRKDAASVAAHASAGGAMHRGGRAGGPIAGGGADFASGGSSSANIADTVSNTLHFIIAPTDVI